MNGQVAAYRGLVESVATELSKTQREPVKNLTEFDDLVQEGFIAVWQALEEGIRPGRQRVEWAMRNYIRSQRGEAAIEPEHAEFDDELTDLPYSPADVLDA